MSNDNAQQQNTQQQKPDKEILDTARNSLDYSFVTGHMNTENDNSSYYNYNMMYYNHNMMRKKLKRWFDRCKKKNASDKNTQEDDLCYYINKDGDILLGKKAKTTKGDSICMQSPCLCFRPFEYHPDGCFAVNTGTQTLRIAKMTYKDFEPFYKEVFGKNAFVSLFEDAWDSFMSYTQLPRQVLSDNYYKAESLGGHAVNIASRILSPYFVTAEGLLYGAENSITTEKELEEMKKNCENNLYHEYANTKDDDLNYVQKRLIDNWISNKMPSMSYNNLKEVLKENQKIYGDQPKSNLNTVNIVNTMNVTQ